MAWLAARAFAELICESAVPYASQWKWQSHGGWDAGGMHPPQNGRTQPWRGVAAVLTSPQHRQCRPQPWHRRVLVVAVPALSPQQLRSSGAACRSTGLFALVLLRPGTSMLPDPALPAPRGQGHAGPAAGSSRKMLLQGICVVLTFFFGSRRATKSTKINSGSASSTRAPGD